MGSEATTTFEVAVAQDRALEAVRRVVSEGRHRLVEDVPDEGRIDFVTRKTMLSWELVARAVVTEAGSGSRVELAVDTAPGRPKALLDGKKNQKSVGKLEEQIRAAAS